MTLSEIRYLVLPVLMAMSVVAGCGTEEESDRPGDTGTDTGESDTGEIDAGDDTGAPDASGCTTPDPSASCMDSGCPDGQICEEVPDGCAPSVCACSDGAWECTADCGPEYACVDDDPEPGCPGPDPSITCLDTGCPDGQSCVEVDGGCTPSSCACMDGDWTCTDDCGPAYACEDDEPPAPGCPEMAPDFRDSCSEEGLECAWGIECCCGECYDSTVCECTDGGWACYATDACFIESCAGRDCDTDTDCEGGGVESTCVDGTCRVVDPGCAGDDAESCESTFGCEWILPSACPEEGIDGLPAPLCAPEQYCGDDTDCPVGFGCVELEVAPRCYWDEPLCDACTSTRTVCVAR